MDDSQVAQIAKIAGGLGATGLGGWFVKKFFLPLISSRSKRLVSDDDVGTKANESLVKQVERLETEITRLSDKLSKRDDKIDEEIAEKNKLLTELFQLKSQMGKEITLLAENEDLKKRLNAAEKKILELEDLLTRMAQAKERSEQPRIVSGD